MAPLNGTTSDKEHWSRMSESYPGGNSVGSDAAEQSRKTRMVTALGTLLAVVTAMPADDGQAVSPQWLVEQKERTERYAHAVGVAGVTALAPVFLRTAVGGAA
jgi:hypothetical protein